MRYFWAFVLIVFGVAGLGSSAGWWDINIIGKLWFFWPLILIFWGLDLLFKKSNIYPLIIFVALLISGFFIFDVAFSEKPIINPGKYREGCCELKSQKINEKLPEGTKETSYEVNTGAVDFKISGATSDLASGDYKSNISELVLNQLSNDGKSKLKLETPGRFNSRFFSMHNSFVNQLNLSLNENLPVTLDVDSGASKLDFDLSNLIVKRVNVSAGASSIITKIGLKTENNAEFLFDCGASTVKLEVPKEIGVKVIYKAGLTTKNLPGFVQDGENTYLSENYQSSEKKIEIVINAGMSTLDVIRY